MFRPHCSQVSQWVGLQLSFIGTDWYLTLLLNNNNDGSIILTLHLDVVILT